MERGLLEYLRNLESRGLNQRCTLDQFANTTMYVYQLFRIYNLISHLNIKIVINSYLPIVKQVE